MSKIGVLLNNIGTPNSPEVVDVKNFLRQFLMDEDVINIPWLMRVILVQGIIVPIRGVSSAEKYKKIWLSEGSPLMVYTRRFADKVQSFLGEDYQVELGMRYGQPSLGAALERFRQKGVHKVIFAPLYPQYAQATTFAAIKELKKVAAQGKYDFQFQTLEPFYHQSFFQDYWLSQFRLRKADSWDHVLFSFHGLPESQIKKTPGCLVTENCCEQQDRCALNCYRAQCFATAHRLAAALQLGQDRYTVSFQSRLGRAKWIQPYTEDTLKALAAQGKANVLIMSPAFVADCVETLEEIQLELRDKFIEFGGRELTSIPCPNDDSNWAQGFAEHVKQLSQ